MLQPDSTSAWFFTSFPLVTILNPSLASSVLTSDTHILLLRVLMPTENVWMTLPIFISSINFKLHELVELCDSLQVLFYPFLMSSAFPQNLCSSLPKFWTDTLLFSRIYCLTQTQVFNHTTLLIISCPHLVRAIQTEVLLKLFLSWYSLEVKYYFIYHTRTTQSSVGLYVI